MVCWPESWLDAAVKCELAYKEKGVYYVYGGDEMRDKIGAFAAAIVKAQGD